MPPVWVAADRPARDVGHQRRVEARFRFVEPLDHVRNNALQPRPEILGSSQKGLPHARIDLSRNPRPFFFGERHAEVLSARDGQHFEPDAELAAQLVG